MDNQIVIDLRLEESSVWPTVSAIFVLSVQSFQESAWMFGKKFFTFC